MPDENIEYIRLDDEHIAEVYPTRDLDKEKWSGVILKRGEEIGRVNMAPSPKAVLRELKTMLSILKRSSIDYQLLTEVGRRSGEVSRYTFTIYGTDIQNIEKLSQAFGEEGNRSLAIRYAVAKVARDMGL